METTPQAVAAPLSDEAGAAPAAPHGVAHPPRRLVTGAGPALKILTVIACVFVLQWAKDFFIPVVFGIFISYTLNPLVAWLERLRIPRVVGTAIVMLGLVGSSAVIVMSVHDEVQSIVDELPLATYKFSAALKKNSGDELSPIKKIQNAAEALKKAADSTGEPGTQPAANGAIDTARAVATPGAAPPPTVIIKQPDFNMGDWLWAGSLGAAAFVGRLTMVLFLVFFLLASGDIFKRKLVKLTGPSLSNKKITVHILDDINLSIQKYMFMLLVTNLLLALLAWIAYHWIGLDNAGAWAIGVALLHVIPYIGTVIAVVAIGAAAFLQFESFSMLLLVPAVTITIATLVGVLVGTWMTGRIAKMNATAVFVALLFGGWLWGGWGLLLCVPVIVVIKVISERVEGMQPIAELLGE